MAATDDDRHIQKVFFRDPLARRKEWAHIAFHLRFGSLSRVPTGRRDATGRESAVAGEPDAPWRMFNGSREPREARARRGRCRFECHLVAVNGPRLGSRDQKPRASFFLSSVMRHPSSDGTPLIRPPAIFSPHSREKAYKPHAHQIGPRPAKRGRWPEAG